MILGKGHLGDFKLFRDILRANGQFKDIFLCEGRDVFLHQRPDAHQRTQLIVFLINYQQIIRPYNEFYPTKKIFRLWCLLHLWKSLRGKKWY